MWDAHLVVSDAKSPKKQHSLESAIFHFSQRMAQILEEDLGEKIDDLDFDKDPHQVVGAVIKSLQEFDKVSRRKTLNIIKPKLESWL